MESPSSTIPSKPSSAATDGVIQPKVVKKELLPVKIIEKPEGVIQKTSPAKAKLI